MIVVKNLMKQNHSDGYELGLLNSPLMKIKATKWMDNNLPSANQGFTGVDYSNKDIKFEDVDDDDGCQNSRELFKPNRP